MQVLNPSQIQFYKRILLYGFVWLLIALAFAGQYYLKAAKLGDGVLWVSAISGALADWFLFAVLSLPAFRLTRLFPLDGSHWRLRVVLHGVAGVVFSLVWILLRTLVVEPILPGRGVGKPINDVLRYVLVATFFFNVLVYWVVVTTAHALVYFRSLEERERRLLELENRLTSARLYALQMQLNPHFLFNALNGISTLMYRDVEAADTMLVALAGLLRHTLDQSGNPLVPLAEEMAFIDRYLALEKMRFGERLQIRHQLGPGTEKVKIPSFLLQPLVENAIKHGLEPTMGPCTILIRTQLLSLGRIRLEVEDTGGELSLDRGVGSGIGTSNCRARLAQIYGECAVFRLESMEGGGTRALLEFPARSTSALA